MFAIDDSNSNQITAGLSARTARATAQQIADRLGETVYLYEDTESSEYIAVEARS